MATVTKARPATTGTAKTSTKPLGAKPSTTPVTAKGGAFAKGAPQAGAAPRPNMGRFMLGMVAYLIGAQVLTFLLEYLNFRNKWNLDHKILFSLPLLGNVSVFTLFYVLSLAGLLYALYKFRILPSAASLRQPQATSTTSAKSATAAKGTLPRAAAGKARADAKTTTVGKPTTAKVMTATAGANTKGTARKAAEPVVEDAASGENDDLYHQVRSQMRAQARKRKR
ncbi:MAG: hypothetical protein H0X24_11675 [Ktedonobacterales bacterium]|nr:hypothetical protein [Ktedonobacterales bacterium]